MVVSEAGGAEEKEVDAEVLEDEDGEEEPYEERSSAADADVELEAEELEDVDAEAGSEGEGDDPSMLYRATLRYADLVERKALLSIVESMLVVYGLTVLIVVFTPSKVSS